MHTPRRFPLGASRRSLLQAGTLGLLGLAGPRAEVLHAQATQKPRAAIYIFLSGGLGQHDSFDLKPDAPADIRGEFNPIDTATPGIQICEHLPLLSQRSQHWALVRSLTHPSNDHSAGHHIMLTGRTLLPPGFNPSAPMPTDWPSLVSVGGAVMQQRNNLPPSVVLPDRLKHYSGRIIPGQFAGIMGVHRDPWFIEASPFDPLGYGAYPEYLFDHQTRGQENKQRPFEAPSLSLPDGLAFDRLGSRFDLLRSIDQQRAELETQAATNDFDRFRQGAISLLTDPRVRQAFDVTRADDATQDRYGRNSFGWSLLMARRLIEAGVNLVQVNLGNNESWDTHGEAFPHLKEKLFPPADKALSALLDDLHESGLLESTVLVMAGEFGRTPRISHLPQFYKQPGRDHWGAVQTVWFAGGGIRGGQVVGSSDKIGAYPAAQAQKPENMAATVYHALGIPETAAWYDEVQRPHHVYHAEPIHQLFS